jgi:hypothetical protein
MYEQGQTDGSAVRFIRYEQLKSDKGKNIARKTQPAASLLAKPTPHNLNLGSDRFAMFNNERDIPAVRRRACNARRDM